MMLRGKIESDERWRYKDLEENLHRKSTKIDRKFWLKDNPDEESGYVQWYLLWDVNFCEPEMEVLPNEFFTI